MAEKLVDIIIERRGKILLTKKGDHWILPSELVGDGEDELQVLQDVVAREIKDQVADIFRKLDNTIVEFSPVRGVEVEVSIYVGDIGTKKMSDVNDCNAHWFSRESLPAIKLSNVTKRVLGYYFSEA